MTKEERLAAQNQYAALCDSAEPENEVELDVYKEGFIAAARQIGPMRPDEHAFHCSLLAKVAVYEYRTMAKKMSTKLFERLTQQSA